MIETIFVIRLKIRKLFEFFSFEKILRNLLENYNKIFMKFWENIEKVVKLWETLIKFDQYIEM